ncbi:MULTISPECIES: hypothetical protein [Bacteroidales]|uniref:hypothetical protein n=1 Tax=Bacteroidales TaxID=171549 RepID=UPI0026098384|nr:MULTISPECIES: hypothetical protein [Bacteroidales]
MAFNPGQKELRFEYFLYKLIAWYKQEKPMDIDCLSLTRIKVLKLLFFTSAIKTDDGNDLLDIFDKFYAMQHGPVESDIYNSISGKLLLNYNFSSTNIILPENIGDDTFVNVEAGIKTRIDNALNKLRETNPQIILYNPFQLVDLSHCWNSWKRTYEIASLRGKRSEKIEIDFIRTDIPRFAI